MTKSNRRKNQQKLKRRHRQSKTARKLNCDQEINHSLPSYLSDLPSGLLQSDLLRSNLFQKHTELSRANTKYLQPPIFINSKNQSSPELPTYNAFGSPMELIGSANELGNFAGFSPSNNLYEIDEYEFENSFDTDFLDDNDFETFSFNDMEDAEDVFDVDNGHYSTSETEASEDDHNKLLDYDSDQELETQDISAGSIEYMEHYFSNISDEDNDSLDTANYSIDQIRDIRTSRSLNSFNVDKAGVFYPNRISSPTKSALKNKKNLTFIVSAKNGDIMDATKYATEFNSENCEGIMLPEANENVYIPTIQTGNKRKHRKAAVIKAQIVSVQNEVFQSQPKKQIGFYTESAFKKYLREINPSMTLTQDIATLRRHSSSIQLNQIQHISKTTLMEIHEAVETNSYSQKGFEQSAELSSSDSSKKSVTWAQKLEW